MTILCPSPITASDPIPVLEEWVRDALGSGLPSPLPMAFVTVGADGRPSARTVGLKLIKDGCLIFTSALWTRKARELAANPHVCLLFHWPDLGRQIHIAGQAQIAERELSQELFAQRPISHRLQSIVSRQGEPIDDLQELRMRHAHLERVLETDPKCPGDWGAICVLPEAIEFWSQATDRLHDRLLFQRAEDQSWRRLRLSP
jgi:pyridoxamine 5'-phosphate oxidase